MKSESCYAASVFKPGEVILAHYRCGDYLRSFPWGVIHTGHDQHAATPVELHIFTAPATLAAEDWTALRNAYLNDVAKWANLSHVNLVPILDWGEEKSHAILVLPADQGTPLSEEVDGKEYTFEAWCRWYLQLVEALEHLHANGLLHGELRPSCILLKNRTMVRLLPFGLHHFGYGAGQPWQGAVSHTNALGYLAPEQITGTPCLPSSDIFTLGTLLYELATKVTAFPSRYPGVILDRILNEEPIAANQIGPNISVSLLALIRNTMAKSAVKRLNSLALLKMEMQHLLTTAIDEEKHPVKPSPRMARRQRSARAWQNNSPMAFVWEKKWLPVLLSMATLGCSDFVLHGVTVARMAHDRGRQEPPAGQGDGQDVANPCNAPIPGNSSSLNEATDRPALATWITVLVILFSHAVGLLGLGLLAVRFVGQLFPPWAWQSLAGMDPSLFHGGELLLVGTTAGFQLYLLSQVLRWQADPGPDKASWWQLCLERKDSLWQGGKAVLLSTSVMAANLLQANNLEPLWHLMPPHAGLSVVFGGILVVAFMLFIFAMLLVNNFVFQQLMALNDEEIPPPANWQVGLLAGAAVLWCGSSVLLFCLGQEACRNVFQ